jgi:hypothetical protein
MKRIVLLLAMLSIAGVAMGNVIPVGNPVETGSWAQAFQESGDAILVDHIQMLMVAPSTFEFPALSDFTVAGWSETYNNGSLAIMDGPAAMPVGWAFHFLPSPDLMATPFTIHYKAFGGQNIAWQGDIVWSGSSWSYPEGNTWDVGRIPEPMTMALLGLGGLLLRRKRA